MQFHCVKNNLHLFLVFFYLYVCNGNYQSCELISLSGGVYSIQHYTLCDKVCRWLMAGQWFSPGTPVSSTNKTDRHDITEILLKVVLNTITLVNVVVLYQGHPFTQIFLHTLTLNNFIFLAIRTLIISEVSNYKDPLSCFLSL